MTVASHRRKLEDQIDNYHRTVLALRALANEILFDDSTRQLVTTGTVHCGRKFRTSPANRRSKDTDVHPDLTIVQSPAYAVIAEAKLGFDSDPVLFGKRIDEIVAQIEKYDDSLTGWPGPIKKSPPSTKHDLVLIVNFEDASRVTRTLKRRRTKGAFAVSRSFAILSIPTLSRARGDWPTLVLEDGALSDPGKTTKLEDRIPINPAVLAQNPLVGMVTLYDDLPPLPFMMLLVHTEIVGRLTDEEQERYNIDGSVDITVTISELRERISALSFKRFDRRDPLIPKAQWISTAVTKLLEMGWTHRSPDSKETIVYHHKKGRKGAKDPLARFVEVCAKDLAKEDEKAVKRREKEKKAMPLFAKEIDGESGPVT